jgi:hypothetical protein
MNIAYFNSVVNQINGLTTHLSSIDKELTSAIQVSSSCEALAALVIKVSEELGATTAQLSSISEKITSDTTAMNAEITKNLAILAPLMVSPTDLPSMITWATSVIKIFSGPYDSYIAQEAVLVTQIARISAVVVSLTAAITSTLSTLNSDIAEKQHNLG